MWYSLINNYLEAIASFLYLLVIFFFYRKKKSRVLISLIIYYFLVTAFLLVATLHVKYKERLWINIPSNIFIYDLVAFFSSIFIGSYYYRLLEKRWQKQSVILLVTSHLIYFAVYNLTLKGPRIFDSIGYAILCATVAIYVFMYFLQVLNNVSEKNLLMEFNFWLSAGYLLYFLGGFVIFISYHYLTVDYLEKRAQLGHAAVKPERTMLTWLWGVNNVLLTITALLLLSGTLWINYRNKSV